VKDWASLAFQVVIALALGWLCWRLARLRRYYHDVLDDLWAEGNPPGADQGP
jgi:hypothetical protein